ncbi:hypothetical protein FC51_GL000215 [Lentilactobacillus parabuchneri DSM 5707 = NBRC 107865]|uniref:Uncharacterized protein n=1 Tax=Lentilactobacillus parabuchneri DSM 5707 = NBRC 107865 TaxID=1423784 RepID=A0A0R1YYH3_9LACO|nr:hypothetical protein FC51_GL000215 [Lentilactobacillus parabuchneri DSM 5707 = NBRC 107865]KRN80242.1 hypothetical protein IV42_GL000562 [Lentilactobacillus parabuchneri]
MSPVSKSLTVLTSRDLTLRITCRQSMIIKNAKLGRCLVRVAASRLTKAITIRMHRIQPANRTTSQQVTAIQLIPIIHRMLPTLKVGRLRIPTTAQMPLVETSSRQPILITVPIIGITRLTVTPRMIKEIILTITIPTITTRTTITRTVHILQHRVTITIIPTTTIATTVHQIIRLLDLLRIQQAPIRHRAIIPVQIRLTTATPTVFPIEILEAAGLAAV